MQEDLEASKVHGAESDPTDEQFIESILQGDLEVATIYLARLGNLNKQMPVRGRRLSPMHLACQIGNLEILKRLIRLQADVDVKDPDGCTPMYFAAKCGHDQLANLLIQAQADVNSSGTSGLSPLYIASRQGHCRVVRLLIGAQADVDDCSMQSLLATPLHAASLYEHFEVVQALVEAQADVSIAAAVGISPLYIASQEGYHDVVQLLTTPHADVNLQDAKGCSPLYIASQNGHVQVVQSLIAARCDVNLSKFGGRSPVYIASQNGHYQVVNALVRAMADVDAEESTGACALYIASYQGHSEVVKFLIKAQANVNIQEESGATCLFAASHRGHGEPVRLLIDAKADVNLRRIHGESALFVACQQGHHQIAMALINANADLNVKEAMGASPIFIAAQEGHVQTVNALIRAGADLNAQTLSGSTPLLVASSRGHEKVVDSLIKAQADLLRTTDEGESPLYIASHQGHDKVVGLLIRSQADVDQTKNYQVSALHVASKVRVVELLIKAQANVSCTAANGLTPLHLAAFKGNFAVVLALIHARADPEAIEENGLTPLNLAAVNGHDEVVEFLKLAVCSKADATLESGVQCPRTLRSKKELQGEQQSISLHKKLSEAGFTESRAALQGAVADVLQDILRKRLQDDEVFVVGSFSETWGNNLATVDGRTDCESDIDVTRLVSGNTFHPRGACQCNGMENQRVEYVNGHIVCPGFAANPAEETKGSALKPAVDKVNARPLCCYPPIAPLLSGRVSVSKILQSVLRSLQNEVSSTHCHVVHAAPQNQAGKQLRVSTTFLEKRLLRSLNTLQGQLFVTLKYLVKKVISNKNKFNLQGLKAYHIKTIVFRMLEKTPPDQWRPEKLVGLIEESLEMLLSNVESSVRQSDNVDGRIMDHFFLCDTDLYLKGVDKRTPEEMKEILKKVAKTLRDVTDQLPELLEQFESTLRPVSEGGRFYFHPFVALPYMNANPLPGSGSVEYHEIYDVVKESLIRLSSDSCSLEPLTDLIGSLPECARTARESLRTLALLKFGLCDAAAKALSDCEGHHVSRGITWSADRTAAEASKEVVWQHLLSKDSAWKFCFDFQDPPRFEFVPKPVSECFPFQMENYINMYFLNFDALIQCLRLELAVSLDDAQEWIRDVAQREDADVQELLLAALHCRDDDLIPKFKARVQETLDSTELVRGGLLDRLRDWYADPGYIMRCVAKRTAGN